MRLPRTSQVLTKTKSEGLRMTGREGSERLNRFIRMTIFEKRICRNAY